MPVYHRAMSFYVLTGGPGVGKTTVVETLRRRGHAVLPEAARLIIEEEVAKSSDVVPWKDIKKFQEAVAQRQIDTEREKGKEAGAVFLDRSLIDGYAYCVLGNVVPPKVILQEGRGRYEKVFLLEPLEEYRRDGARKEERELALVIHREIVNAYERFGYSVIRVPVLSAEARAEFIVNAIADAPAR